MNYSEKVEHMGLRVAETSEEHLLSVPVMEALRKAQATDGTATLLVASFAQALCVQQALASTDLALGTRVSTPYAWAEERWELWGDGRRIISSQERIALLQRALTVRSASELSNTAGMSAALAALARDVLAWLPTEDCVVDAIDVHTRSLTPGERAVLDLLHHYQRLLQESDLIECCEAMAALPNRIVSPQPLVVAGIPPLSFAARELVCALSAHTDVLVSLRCDQGPAGELAQVLVSQLQATAKAHHIPFERLPASALPTVAEDAQTVPELDSLRRQLFSADGKHDKLVSTGAVRLLEAAGPLCEWELVAREVGELAEQGASEVLVVAADVDSAWHQLAPKLAARGLEVSATLSHPATQESAVRAFMSFARSVAQLAELAQTWPDCTRISDGSVVQLGDMSWWPPRALTDFLSHDIAGMEASRVHALDARWRGNRILTPALVLEQLQRESLTSRCVAQATAALMKGRIGAAAQALARSLDQTKSPYIAPLNCVSDVARQLAGLHMGFGLSRTASDVSLSLTQLVELTEEMLSATLLHPSLVLPAQTAGPCFKVRICSRSEAAALPPHSVDALIAANLTVEEWSLAPADDALAAFAQHLGLALHDDELAFSRAQFAAIVAVPRHTLVLERTLHNRDAHVIYPATMYTEVLACFGSTADTVAKEGLLPLRMMSEQDVSKELSATGTAPACEAVSFSAPAGVIGSAAADMIIVPREGQDSLLNGRPALSASQIESYLECPYKWFTLRRLGLSASDATFSAMQMGSFAHRVLEVARKELLQRAAVREGLVQVGESFEIEDSSVLFVPGSAITHKNIEEARSIVSSAFDVHLEHQLLSATTFSSQSLVPHSATERWRLELLRQDLLSVLDFEQDHLHGFEPRAFELRFGSARPHAHHVSYAGADFLGSIDRVDIDAHGRAVVIDYKHKARNGFSAEYDAFADTAPATASEFVLPRRVQALIYAQVVRRLYPALKVVGAVYLSTMGTRPRDHEIAGVLSAEACEQVMGEHLSPKRASHLSVGGSDQLSFEELLDECELRIADAIERMVAGDITAQPSGAHACLWCPVANCERRLA